MATKFAKYTLILLRLPVYCHLLALAGIVALTSCSAPHARSESQDEQSGSSLGVITVEYGANQAVEREFFEEFGREKKTKINFLLPFETMVSMVHTYRELLHRHAPEPDLYEVDVVWPALLANDLIDLTPYFKDELKLFDRGTIRNFTVGGRLIALPTFLDVGVLFYRPDLLKAYGFRNPPTTWSELERMARIIQAGERKRGSRDFWGYVWQGGSYEALTCNALEWQAAAGAPLFLTPDGAIHVTDPIAIGTLKRASAWIGTISPPGEAWYRELDARNLFNEGEAAFARNWTSSYSGRQILGQDRTPFLVARMPGGHGTLGGLGMGISKYSRHRELAVEALRGLTSERIERKRVAAAAVLPTRVALLQDAKLMSQTVLRGGHADEIIASAVARPSTAAGSAYAEVSAAYFRAVNSVLAKRTTAEQSMADLDSQLHSLLHPKPSH